MITDLFLKTARQYTYNVGYRQCLLQSFNLDFLPQTQTILSCHYALLSPYHLNVTFTARNRSKLRSR